MTGQTLSHECEQNTRDGPETWRLAEIEGKLHHSTDVPAKFSGNVDHRRDKVDPLNTRTE